MLRKLLPLSALTLVLGVARAHAAPETVALSGAMPDLKTLQLDSAHVYDYTFAVAPTDWRVASGTWEMTNRWSCSPGWSWFGGRSDETAAIWNKRKLLQDLLGETIFVRDQSADAHLDQ